MSRVRTSLPALLLGAALGCGARTPLGIDRSALAPGDAAPDASPIPDPGSDSGPPGPHPRLCGAGTAARIVGAITVDAANRLHEAESDLRLVWAGSEALLAYNSWDDGSLHMRLAALRVGATGIDVASSSKVGVGNSSNPSAATVAWDGTALGRFWAQDDGSVVLQHFGADAAPLDARRIVIPASGRQTLTSSAVMSGAAYLLVWAVEEPSHFENYVGAFAYDGTPGPSTILYTGSLYDIGAALAYDGKSLFGLWSKMPRNDPLAPVSTIFARIDPSSGAVISTTEVDKGVSHFASGLAAEPGQLDMATWNGNTNTATVLSIGAAGGTARTRALLDHVSSPLLVTDACGLVAVVPNESVGGRLPTALSLRRIGEGGVTGSPLALPLTETEIESFTAVDTPAGLLVAWIEFERTGVPSRVLRAALASLP